MLAKSIMSEAAAVPEEVTVRVNTSTLARLVAQRQVSACELHCLDGRSKKLLRRICLDSCLSRR